jgi:hypothetical protein
MRPVLSGLSHVAMSVPEGTLTDEYRADVLEFYGKLFGWREIESLRLPDRLTISIGGSCYINLRERPEVMVCHGYEHFGVLVDSVPELEQLWSELAQEQREMHLEPLSIADEGFGSFRFRYLLPMAVEVQFFP